MVVANKELLPELTEDNKSQYQGRFYYIEDIHVLAVASDSMWVQINPDTRIKSEDQNTNVIKYEDKITITSIVESENAQTNTKSNTSKGSYSFVAGDNIKLDISNDNNIIISSLDTDTIQTISVDNTEDKVGF